MTDHTTTVAGETVHTESRGWLSVSSVALGSFAIVLSEFLPIGLLPAISADLDVGIGTAGLLVVLTGLFAAIAAPVVTVATTALDRRLVLAGLSALLVVSDALAALAPSFAVLLLARVLLGTSLGGFWAVGAGLAGRLVPPADAIRGTAVITAGISVATVVSLPLGAAVSALTSWRVAFVIGGAIGLVALGLQLMTLPRMPATHRVRVATLGALFRVPRARIGLLAAAVLFFSQFAAYTFVSPYLEDVVAVGPGTVTLALLLFGTAGIVGNFVIGALLGRSLVGTTAAAEIVLAATVLLLPSLAHSTPGAIALVAVWGFVWGGLPLAMQMWMSTASPAGAETGLSLFVTTIQLALAAGSVLGGVAVTSWGIDADFRLAGVIALVGALAFLALGSRSRAVDPAERVHPRGSTEAAAQTR
jgi:predicted MFS family arabinose efflux permease